MTSARELTIESSLSAPVRVRWWNNRGLHAHVTYPDGCWERMTWKGDPWWELDSLVITLEREWGKDNVQVTP